MTTKSLANLLRTLSSKRRLEIMEILLQSESPVSSGNISKILGLASGPTSNNLRELGAVGLVVKASHGKHVFYSPNRQVIEEIGKFFTNHTQEKSSE